MNERIFNRILAGRAINGRTVSFLEPYILEFSITPTVSHEVYHQNFKHQQRHPSRNG